VKPARQRGQQGIERASITAEESADECGRDLPALADYHRLRIAPRTAGTLSSFGSLDINVRVAVGKTR